MIEILNEIKNKYDAYYFANKYGEANTHKEQFKKLSEYLKEDELSQRALNWISQCYDCYYVNEYNEENNSNPFYYLENKIKEYESRDLNDKN